MEIVTQEICIKTLRSCALSKRRGLAQEVAIMLAVLAGDGINQASRRRCAELYDAADDGATEASGRTFRAIRHRIDACVALAEKIGADELMVIVGKNRGEKAVAVLADHVASLNLFSVDAIYAYSGRRRSTGTSDQDGEHQDQPATPSVEHAKLISIKTQHIKIEIPDDVSIEEIEQLALKLMRLADRQRKNRRHASQQQGSAEIN